jgi:RNA polymerase sigma factor for flagellar operon FliA
VEPLEQQWWIDYKQGDSGARDHLLEKYLPFAKRLTSILYARRPQGNAEFGDYLHLAYIGLIEAMQRYQYEANAAFSTYAAYRIKGSILNGIPKMSERGEYVSYLRRVQRERTQSLLDVNSRRLLNFSETVELIVNIALTHQLDELAAEIDGGGSDGLSDLYASHSYGELKNHLRSIVVNLPQRDQKIIYYHYFNYMSFDDIAKLLNISKGRVSQLHKRTLSELRTKLHGYGINSSY